MSETPEPTITAEMIAAYQRQQAAQEQQSMQHAIDVASKAVGELGYEIVAVPQLSQDGRIVAAWGVRRKAQ